MEKRCGYACEDRCRLVDRIENSRKSGLTPINWSQFFKEMETIGMQNDCDFFDEVTLSVESFYREVNQAEIGSFIQELLETEDLEAGRKRLTDLSEKDPLLHKFVFETLTNIGNLPFEELDNI